MFCDFFAVRLSAREGSRYHASSLPAQICHFWDADCLIIDRDVQILTAPSLFSLLSPLTGMLAQLLLFWKRQPCHGGPAKQIITTTGKGLTMAKVYCKYCGNAFSSVQSLTSTTCPRHPDGVGKGRHALYEGDEAPEYTCKYCGKRASTIASLTSTTCPRHPDGNGKGRHSPAL